MINLSWQATRLALDVLVDSIGTLLLRNVNFVQLITTGTSILRNVSVVLKVLFLIKKMLSASVTQLIPSSTRIQDNAYHAMLLVLGTILTLPASVHKALLLTTQYPRNAKLVLRLLLSGTDINAFSVLLVITTTISATAAVLVRWG